LSGIEGTSTGPSRVEVAAARTIAEWITHDRIESFTLEQARRAGRNPSVDKAVVEAALAALCSSGWIRKTRDKPPKVKGTRRAKYGKPFPPRTIYKVVRRKP
jgi:hypothetical protein